MDQDNLFPNELWKKLGDLGVLGVTVGEEYGAPASATWPTPW